MDYVKVDQRGHEMGRAAVRAFGPYIHVERVGNYIRILMVSGWGCKGRGDSGVRFDPSTLSTRSRRRKLRDHGLNELRGEAGKVLEPVERPGAGGNV